MKKIVSALVSAALLVLAVAARPVSSSRLSLYVDAVHGSDAGNGTAASPFATLARAAAALRALQPLPPNTGAIVSVASGDYVSADGVGPVLALTAADNGRADARIEWIAAPGARLLGGVKVPSTAWKPYAGNILQANVSTLGVSDFGTLLPGSLGTCTSNFSELVYNGKPQIVARYPNLDAASPMLLTWMNIANGSGSAEFEYNDERVSSWAGFKDVFAGGYWSYDWAYNVIEVSKIDAAENVVVGNPATPPVYGYQPSARWFGFHILSELDMEGEYFFDFATTGMAYWYAPAGYETGDVFISTTDVVLELKSVSHVSFSGFTVAGGKRTSVVASGVSDVELVSMAVVAAGGVGISLSGTQSHIGNCTVLDAGCSALEVVGGDFSTLTPGGNLIDGNVLMRFSRFVRTYTPGIAFASVGDVFRGNTVAFAPHAGMLGGANNCVFSGNVFETLCFEVSDSGAWYAGRSWAHLNNTLVDNSFSNIYVQVPIFLGYKQVQGVYLDDQLSFHTIVNNTFTSCDVGMLLGGGRNHTVTGNRFVNCTTCLNMDDRGDTWQKAYCEPGGIFEQQLDALHYKEPPYSVAYPGLVDIMAERPCDPVFNNIVGNTYCDIPNGFADVTPAQVAAWGSYMADNMEHC